jgi:hypothetical protein
VFREKHKEQRAGPAAEQERGEEPAVTTFLRSVVLLAALVATTVKTTMNNKENSKGDGGERKKYCPYGK